MTAGARSEQGHRLRQLQHAECFNKKRKDDQSTAGCQQAMIHRTRRQIFRALRHAGDQDQMELPRPKISSSLRHYDDACWHARPVTRTITRR